MTITEIQGARNAEASSAPERGVGGEVAAKAREIARAVKQINEGGGLGPSSELRFSIDQNTGQTLLRIVDRVTDEVITQLPPETVLRAAEILKSLQPGDRIA